MSKRKRNARGRFIKRSSSRRHKVHSNPRKHYTRKRRASRRSHSRRGHRNAVRRMGFLGGLVKLPSVNELLWVGGGAIAIPTLARKIEDFLPAMFKGGWGSIATEFVTGSALSAAVRKFVSPMAGDMLFTVTLVRTLPRVASQLTGGAIGGGLSDYGQLGGWYAPRLLPVAAQGLSAFVNEVPDNMAGNWPGPVGY